jgi:lysophospholipase L1-like esterase
VKYPLLVIGLAPLLIAEGLYVRYSTPRLPEPPGERSGLAGNGRDLSLLILGDSAAAGVGVYNQRQALSGQLVSTLGATFRLSWNLIAQTGHRAADIVTVLKKMTPEKYDVVVTSIGVNDVTHGTKTSKWIEQLSQIVEILKATFHTRYIIISGIPPMHLFPALPQPLRWFIGTRAMELNSASKKFIKNCADCEFVTIDFPLEAAYMAADGFHPGEPAYALWAKHLGSIICARLSSRVNVNAVSA